MPISVIRVYLDRIPGLKAERKLMGFETYSAVWMEKMDRRNLLRTWERTAFGETEIKKATRGDRDRMGIGTG